MSADEPALTASQAAAIDFDGMDLEDGLIAPDQFLQDARRMYGVLAIGEAMLRKSAPDLADVFRVQGEDGIIGALDELADAKAWFDGFAKVLGVVEARALIAASRAALDLGAVA